MDLSQSAQWRELQAHKLAIETLQMREMFLEDSARFERFSIQWEGLTLDYSKNRITPRTMELLLDLARNAWL